MSVLVMLQVLDDNVKRGSRVFESNHVRNALCSIPSRISMLS